MCNSKVIHSLSLLLLFSLFLTGFGSVNASAAENLVNPFLEQWEHTASGTPGTSPSGNTYMHVVKHQMPGSSQITYALRPSYVGSTGSDGSTKLYYGYMFDKNSLKSGNSYTFSMHIPSPDEIRANTTYLWDDSGFAARMGDGFIFCFGTIDSTGQNFTPLVEFLSLTTDNYLSLAGTDYVSSFECPDYSGGNPCLYIIAMNVGSTSLLFLDDSMQLVDNAAEDEEGFFTRLFEWFEKKFNAIGESFSNLGDRIKTFFSDLGNSISSGLTAVKEGIQDKLDQVKTTLVDLGESLINGIKSLFVPSDDFFDEFKTNMDKLLEDHLGFVYQGSRTFFQLFQSVYNLIDAPDELPGSSDFIFPSLDFTLNYGRGSNSHSHDIDLTDSQTVDLSFLNDEGSFWYTFYHVYYKAILYIIFAGAILLYGYNTFEKLFR